MHVCLSVCGIMWAVGCLFVRDFVLGRLACWLLRLGACLFENVFACCLSGCLALCVVFGCVRAFFVCVCVGVLGGWLAVCLYARLCVCDRLVGWLVDWLARCLSVCLFVWLCACLSVGVCLCLRVYVFDRLVGWLVGCLRLYLRAFDCARGSLYACLFVCLLLVR